MHAGGRLADGEEPLDGRGARPRVDLDATHAVVGGGRDLHGLLGYVHTLLHKLLVHVRQPVLDVAGVAVGNVEQHRPVRGAAAVTDLAVVGARHDIARVELHVLGRVPLHEAFALIVVQATALPPDGLGHEPSVHLLGLDHPRRVELDELHVLEGSPGLVGERHRVPVVLVGAGGPAPVDRGIASRGQDDRASPEHETAPAPHVEARGAVDPPAALQQLRHVDVLAVGDALFLGLVYQRAQDRLARRVPGKAGAAEGLGAEVALVQLAFVR